MGSIEVTRLGLRETEMEAVADLIARVLVEKEAPEDVVEDVIEFRQPFQTLYYCFDNGLPA
jgi:glycine hydroxymethyltransferase